MPRLLILSPLWAAPPLAGAPARTYYLARALGQEFAVTLFTPEAPLPPAGIAEWEESLHGVRLRRMPWWYGPFPPESGISRWDRIRDARYRKAWKGHPFGIVYMPLLAWHRAIAAEMERNRPDAVMLEQSWNLETLRWIRRRWPGVRIILNAHNVESDALRRYAETSHLGIGPMISRVTRRESSLGRYADRIWSCSATDRHRFSLLNARHPVPCDVIPNGVDTRHVAYAASRTPGNVLLFAGTLSYQPNADAALWFAREILPLIRARRPEVRFRVAGRWAPESFRAALAGMPGTELAGEVADMRAELRGAAVSVCPMRSGSGTRLKILEAMSAGVPVISTSVGAEGIEARNGTEYIRADMPQAFADAVLRVLHDDTFAEKLRANARRLMERSYEWDTIGADAVRSVQSLLR
jgi:glycosyltransferase involved in cell wall biosynthesis